MNPHKSIVTIASTENYFKTMLGCFETGEQFIILKLPACLYCPRTLILQWRKHSVIKEFYLFMVVVHVLIPTNVICSNSQSIVVLNEPFPTYTSNFTTDRSINLTFMLKTALLPQQCFMSYYKWRLWVHSTHDIPIRTHFSTW